MLFLLSLMSCTPKSAPQDNTPSIDFNMALKEHSKLALDLWNVALADALSLKKNIELLTDNPDQNNLSSAQESWRKARQSYSKTEALRFQEGPIDHAEHGVESRLNAWPLDELYIEGNDTQKGIIDSADLDITAKLLIEKNEAMGEESISLGYHAIEFLLWGVDEAADGPGERSC